MTTKTEIQQHLCAALSAETDTLLTSRSFSRKVHSIEYKRQCKEGEQLLQMYFEFRPSSQPRADSRIYPWITVVLPKLNRVALDMVNHVSLLIGDPNITFSQPIDFVIPKERHIAWYTYGRESAFECVRAIRSSLETWVLPFLDEYTTARSLMAAYEMHDQRFGWQRPFYIYVAAAYILAEQVESASKVLADHFGRPGSRRKYATAFEYVAARLKKD